MKETRALMGMPITVEVVGQNATKQIIEEVFDYFNYVDHKYSPYKTDSDIGKINSHELLPENYGEELKSVLDLCEKTKLETGGYFNIKHNGKIDPSGLVKGWAIYNAAELIQKAGFHNYYVEAGGDIEVAGVNSQGEMWTVGIRNPFNKSEIVKVLRVSNCGVATSGTYERGQHIYNSERSNQAEIVSLTIIGPNIYEADRFATAAFAMGKAGINFIEQMDGFEGYLIDKDGLATFTSHFENYVKPN
jgi:FAD:protein FMN transferase